VREVRREPLGFQSQRRRQRQDGRVGSLLQVRQAGGRGHERAAGVDLLDEIVAAHVDLLGRRQIDRRGVVDADIDAAEGRRALLGRGEHAGLVAHVDHERQRPPPGLLHLRGGRKDRPGELGVGLGGLGGDGDVGAVARRAQRDREPDTAARPRYEKRLALQTHVGPFSCGRGRPVILRKCTVIRARPRTAGQNPVLASAAPTRLAENGLMRLQKILGALLLMSFAGGVSAQQEDLSRVEVKSAPLGANLYLLTGSGGNIAALTGADGVLLVDDEFGVLAERNRAALKALGAAQAPRFIVNTHYHFDHTDGNEAFAKMGALVIAQTQLRSRLAAGGIIGNGGSIAREVKPAPAAALPALTYQQELTLYLDGETVRV